MNHIDPTPVWLVGPTLWSKTAGVERCVRSWAPRLRELGFNLHVGTFHDDPPPLVEGVPWLRLNPEDIPYLDGLVVANSWVGDPPANPGIVVHHSVPSLQPLDQQPEGRRSIEDHASYCAAFGEQLAVSRFTKHAVETRLSLPCGTVSLFAHEAFAAQVRVPNGERHYDVLYASRLIERKGALLTLAAADLLPAVRFTFINNDPDPHIADLIQSRGHLLMEPLRNPDLLAAVMTSHRVLAMPTLLETEEAFGLLSIEAQFAGAQVVATASGGLPETDCGAFRLTDPTGEALAGHIEDALRQDSVELQPDMLGRWSLSASVRSLASHLARRLDFDPQQMLTLDNLAAKLEDPT